VRLIVLCSAFVVASCYAPSIADCTLTCAAGSVCPSGFDCVDNYCRVTGMTNQCLNDAGSDLDGSPDGSPDVDSDMDGLSDADDNCRFVANADQLNEDMDELGDVCDPCPPFRTYAAPGNPNADANVDTDGDGVGDGCDPRPAVAGEHLRLFVGFSGTTAPPGSQSLGPASAWAFTGGRAIATGSGTQLVALLWDVPIDAQQRAFVSSRIEIVSFRAVNGARAAGVADSVDLDTGRSAACVIGLDDPGAPHLMLLDTQLASDVIITKSPDVAGAGAGVMTNLVGNRQPESMGTSHLCTSALANVIATPTLVSSSTRLLGLRARGVTAAFSWLMVVDSPL
jgi:hypothetical protein